jgi:hypothetical protein
LISNNFFDSSYASFNKVKLESKFKLCSYSKFKTYFGLEKYLCILKSFEQRRNFTRFRISSHSLQIERGRYQGNYIVLCFIKLEILARISSFSLLRSQYNFCSGLRTWKLRRNFTRFRISSHSLQIERGRYQGALRQNRLCLRCTSGEIDDEKHFLISCSTCHLYKKI